MDDERQVGRVVFLPDVWQIQTLHNHVNNVVSLVDQWDEERDFLDHTPDMERTRSCLRRAAEIHDMGKPRRFQLTYDQKGWSYSFAGHRFDALDRPGDEYTPYVEALAHLHHEFSVSGITQRMAQLRLHSHLSGLAGQLPLDLYILEMCDQIEASVASAFLNDVAPTARVFMDFQFDTVKSGLYRVDPFVFHGDAVRLEIEWGEITPEVELTNAVQKASERGDAYKERAQLRDWLVRRLQEIPLQRTEVTLCPWN